MLESVSAHIDALVVQGWAIPVFWRYASRHLPMSPRHPSFIQKNQADQAKGRKLGGEPTTIKLSLKREAAGLVKRKQTCLLRLYLAVNSKGRIT